MALTNLAILATQNKRPSPESITSDVAHIHLLPKFPVRVSRVKSHLWMVTVVRMVSPVSYQQLAGSHRENVDGHSGKSFSDQQFASHRTDTGDHSGREIGTPPNASRLDPTIWSDLYEERAAHRQFDGGYPRIEAELLAWRDIEWRWHLAHRERASAEVCAGCGQLILPDETLDLIDGARVHMKEYRCRIAYEQRWRSAATNALIALGLQPPATEW